MYINYTTKVDGQRSLSTHQVIYKGVNHYHTKREEFHEKRHRFRASAHFRGTGFFG